MNFVLGGHYSPVNYVRGGGGGGEQYSPVNNVRGDILWGDSVHYDNVSLHKASRLVVVYPSSWFLGSAVYSRD